ncbi:MAG TPA: hypothetical protein VMW72_04225 [Sedimentisphaerales bacterium]|nr:hypothetical protein [Sedimentisphaerales bacterium]
MHDSKKLHSVGKHTAGDPQRGGAWGVHPFGGNAQDPEAIEFFKRYLVPGLNN